MAASNAAANLSLLSINWYPFANELGVFWDCQFGLKFTIQGTARSHCSSAELRLGGLASGADVTHGVWRRWHTNVPSKPHGVQISDSAEANCAPNPSMDSPAPLFDSLLIEPDLPKLEVNTAGSSALRVPVLLDRPASETLPVIPKFTQSQASRFQRVSTHTAAQR
ncbi:MAG TPA: hypothetical protein DDW52_10470 [Planctomycetaceae bacterium]|nr:hypothetical protein [Planctomycetaceae bacterium]